MRPESLLEQLKIVRAARAQHKKNLLKLSPEKRQRIAELRDRKEVGNYKLPGSPEFKKGKGKGKGKGKEDTRHWVPCPLLPGVPPVPPPRILQPWELSRQIKSSPSSRVREPIESCSDDYIIEGTPSTPPCLPVSRSGNNWIQPRELFPAPSTSSPMIRKIQSPTTAEVPLDPSMPLHSTNSYEKMLKDIGLYWVTTPSVSFDIEHEPSAMEHEASVALKREESGVIERQACVAMECEVNVAMEREASVAMEREASVALKRDRSVEMEHQACVALERAAIVAMEREAIVAMEREASVAMEHEDSFEMEREASVALKREASIAIIREASVALKREINNAIDFAASITMEREASVAIEREASVAMEREVSVAMEREASVAMEREASVAMEREASVAMEREASVAMEREASVAMEREASVAMEREASVAMEREASVAMEREASVAMEREASVAMEREASVAMEREASVTIKHEASVDHERAAFPEKTPPKKKLSKAKKQKIQLSSSAEIILVTESDFNLNSLEVVDAHIDFQGFTPSSSTTFRTMTTSVAPSDRANEIEDSVVVNLVEETEDANNGSDFDYEPLGDISLQPHDVLEFNVEDIDDVAFAAVQEMDAADDEVLKDVVGSEQDLLNFEWRGEIDNFEGVREQFTAPSGPTFNTKGLTPLEVFKKIWDGNIIAHIVRETNRYARLLIEKNRTKPGSRLARWVDTTDDEIWTFFGIIILQSLVVNSVEREYWYPKFEELRVGDFGKLMPYNRFVILKRCLHFVDNTSLPVNPEKLSKVKPILEHLNNKFSSLYLPGQNVAIDESLLKWKGRLSFAQLIANKKAKVGIKSYELCESSTGYLWKFKIYTGKEHDHSPQETQTKPEAVEVQEEPDSATSQIVFTLMRPLFDRGHTLVMDNFYHAPLLSRILKRKHKTDTMGTLRLNREFVPSALKGKTKHNMRAGEVCFSTTKDLSVLVWMDKNVVPLISTYHGPVVGGKEKYGYYKYKPKVVLDYNLSMGGIDHKDQMLHSYPIERDRNTVWYKKLFRRLLNVSIHNAFVLFNHNNRPQMQNRDFRMQLAQEIVKLQLNSRSVPTPVRKQTPKPKPAPTTSSEMHLPEKNAKKQRCKFCYEANVKRTTMWKCGTCQVNLCLPGCYTGYHNQRR